MSLLSINFNSDYGDVKNVIGMSIMSFIDTGRALAGIFFTSRGIMINILYINITIG